MRTRRNQNQHEEWIKKLYLMKASIKYLKQIKDCLIIREKSKKTRLEIENLLFEYKITNNKEEKKKIQIKLQELYKLYVKPPKEIDLPNYNTQLAQKSVNNNSNSHANHSNHVVNNHRDRKPKIDESHKEESSLNQAQRKNDIQKQQKLINNKPIVEVKVSYSIYLKFAIEKRRHSNY